MRVLPLTVNNQHINKSLQNYAIHNTNIFRVIVRIDPANYSFSLLITFLSIRRYVALVKFLLPTISEEVCLVEFNDSNTICHNDHRVERKK